MTEAEERAALRHIIEHARCLNDYVAGGAFCAPMTPNESALFTKLGRKYKYDKEFEDVLHPYQFKNASSRSKDTQKLHRKYS